MPEQELKGNSIERKAVEIKNLLTEMVSSPQTREEGERLMKGLAYNLGPFANAILETIHKNAPAESRVMHGDHQHVVIFHEGEEGKGAAIIVTMTPANSNQNPLLHIHPPDVEEYILAADFGLELLLNDSSLSLLPSQPYRISEGTAHSIRNTGSCDVFSVDVRFKLKDEKINK